ncbi:transposase, partial [Embleya sp. NPDC005971]|uniref:transposase n=1 Tax=Embleya sp. NPDC005971 TaxID=3156724 RepID=UPI00340F95A6
MRSARFPTLPRRASRSWGSTSSRSAKAGSFGTVLVDVETRRPIDLLPDRTVETVAAWLSEHPGIEVICRDRCSTFSQAAAREAPDAIQVADRWQCAMRRLVVSPTQSGGTWREVLGSNGLPNP